MSAVRRSSLVRVFLRSFCVQGSWNYRTLIGGGFAYALIPALKDINRNDPAALDAAVTRHAGLFNSHPYLSTMALGAVTTLEADHENPLLIDRFKAAVRGSLGTLGDRLFWAGIRPVSLLVAMTMLFFGAPWWSAVLAFLLLYNTAHIAVRIWAFRVGLHQGKAVGEQLRRHPVAEAQRWTNFVGAFLAGVILPLVAVSGLVATAFSAVWLPAAAIAAIIGARFGPLIRTPVVLGLALFCVLGLLVRIVF